MNKSSLMNRYNKSRNNSKLHQQLEDSMNMLALYADEVQTLISFIKNKGLFDEFQEFEIERKSAKLRKAFEEKNKK